MPCPDFVSARAEKSVPPKKLHSWRTHSISTPEEQSLNSTLEFRHSTPDAGGNLLVKMGSNTTQSESQNDNGKRYEPVSPVRNSSEDMPLDFSLKPNPKSRFSADIAMSSQDVHPAEIRSYGHPFRISNEQRNGGPHSHISNGIDPRFSSNIFKNESMETTISPKNDRNAICFNMSNSREPTDSDLRSSTRGGIRSPHSPHLHSPSSSSKSPILAGMLTRSSPDILPVMPIEVLNSRLIAFGLQNGYHNGPSPMCLPTGIQSPNPVMANPAVFPQNNIIATPGMAFMRTQVNLLPPVSPLSPPAKVENKAPRKVKQERPFKNYDVSLQENFRWLPPLGPVSVNASTGPPSVSASTPPDATHSGSRNISNPDRSNIMNGNSDCSSNSDSATSETDNVPHSSVPNSSSPVETIEMAAARGRKRKPVADAEKDACYWERRKKNNQAAKRSRENRRIKEDTVAQQALYFRGETNRLSQILIHLNARVHDITMKCASLEQDKLNLTAENARFKQLVVQKRCGQCGTQL